MVRRIEEGPFSTKDGILLHRGEPTEAPKEPEALVDWLNGMWCTILNEADNKGK